MSFEIKFVSHGRKAECQPDPNYPNGMVADVSRDAAIKCSTDLPYPAECIGVWLVKCKTCNRTVAVTAAGRADDTKAVIINCNKRVNFP